MVLHPCRLPIHILSVLLSVSLTPLLANPQGGLETIDPPQGGKIVYGQVQGQTTEAGAMGAVLRNLHQNLGDKPQVGKLFQVHGTQSVAAFFSVNRKTPGQPTKQIAGLIIATKVTTDHVEAALVTDDAARFQKTLSPMMKTLFAAWHPFAGSSSAGTHGASGAPAAALHQVTTQDSSATIGLPDGWKLVPSMSSMGTIVANGPNGESAEMGITFLAADPNNPAVQRTMQTLRNGGLQHTAYATASYIPFNSDLSKSFVFQIQKLRQKAGLSQATYNFTSVTPESGNGQSRCVHMVGTVDFNDGKGTRVVNILYCADPPNRFGNWLSAAYMTSAPTKIAPAERATLGAILQSFNVNQSIVARQAQQIAQPEIDRIHAIGRASAQAAEEAHKREEIHNSSVYKRWDDNDKRSQEFENYQLGYTVISTTDNSAHGTFWNEDADALVKEHPDKFEYVAAPDYWKGIDY